MQGPLQIGTNTVVFFAKVGFYKSYIRVGRSFFTSALETASHKSDFSLNGNSSSERYIIIIFHIIQNISRSAMCKVYQGFWRLLTDIKIFL